MPAESKAQQRLMGMAYAAKKNKIPDSELPPAVAKLKAQLSKKQLRDFAATKTDDLPEKKETSKRASIADKIYKMASNIRTLPSETTSQLSNTNALNLKQFGRPTASKPSAPARPVAPVRSPRVPVMPAPSLQAMRPSAPSAPTPPAEMPIKRASISSKMMKYAGKFDRLAQFLSKNLNTAKGWASNASSRFKNAIPPKDQMKSMLKSKARDLGAFSRRHAPAAAVGASVPTAGYLMFGGKGNASPAPSRPSASGTSGSTYKDIKNIFNKSQNPDMWSDIGKIGGSALGALALTSILTSGMDDGFLKSALQGLGTLGGAYAGSRWAGYNPGDWYDHIASALSSKKDPSMANIEKASESLDKKRKGEE